MINIKTRKVEVTIGNNIISITGAALTPDAEHMSRLEKVKAYLLNGDYYRKAGDDVAYKKERVLTGRDANGNPMYEWIRGETQEERDDKKFLSYLRSGRAWDFPEFRDLVDTHSPTPVVVAAPEPEIPKHNFEQYA